MLNQYTFSIWACGFKTFLVPFLIGKSNTKFLLASFKKHTKFKNPFMNPLQRACCGILKPAVTVKLAPEPGCVILKIVLSTAHEISKLR